MTDYKSAVREYILENFLMGSDGSDLADDQSFLEHHIIDSTGFIELVTHLETTYSIQVKDDEMIPENLDSLAAIERFLTRKLQP